MGWRRGRERAGAVGNGRGGQGNSARGRARQTRPGDGQGRVRRTRAGAASKDKATRVAGGEDRRMGTGWVVARSGGEEKDGKPQLKSPPLLKPPCGRQTRAVVRQRPLPAHHQRGRNCGGNHGHRCDMQRLVRGGGAEGGQHGSQGGDGGVCAGGDSGCHGQMGGDFGQIGHIG